MQGAAGAGGGRRGGPTFHLILAALLAQTGAGLASAGYEMVEVGRVVVFAPRGQLSLAIALAEQADRGREWPGLGYHEPGAFRLVVVPDREGFGRVAGGRLPAWGVGLAIPAARTVAVRADAPDPAAALRHELAHLALHDVIRGRVPLWFDEGYAVMAAGELGRLEALRLNLAVVRGAVGDLRRLDGSLRRAAGEAEAAYALAGSAVMLLARLHPTGTLDPLIARLAAGEPFGEAVLATTGYTLDGFDRAWQRDVRRRFGWMVWLGAGGLWLVVALAVTALAVARRRRDRERRAALDEGWAIPLEEAALDQEPQAR